MSSLISSDMTRKVRDGYDSLKSPVSEDRNTAADMIEDSEV